MREKEIEEKIWKIIKETIEEAKEGNEPAWETTRVIRKRVHELLDEEHAILVYKP